MVFALLALWDFVTPLVLAGDSGFVFLGKRLSGAPNLIAAWAFAVFLTCYAAALWRERAAALPLGIAYAAYLCVNLHYALLFTFRNAEPPTGDARVFGASNIIAIAVACGAVAATAATRRGEAGPDQAPGRVLLRSFALLFALMAVSNALKPFAYAPDIGFIFFGHRLAGTANVIAALAFSALLAVYAASIWTERRLALPLGIVYALYVPANILLWGGHRPEEDAAPAIFTLPYLAGAIGVSGGAAFLLWRHRKRLI